ncbi:MAG: carboxypeptidase regulatory-like domain-containing protein [Betaproteobacteria bacterium]|nr:MAG: carboxypeptidase regulatory-like domain-containing protein [Betaproteobacteria bacterium]
MTTTRFSYLMVVGVSLLLAACQVPPGASQAAGIGESDLAGIVTGANGPEAGVWVIAETNDLPTKFAKIVVTDDRGRYLIPELPKANYSVWVRGYGLVDSPKVQAAPGRILDLTAVVAPSAAAAAQYYPAIYWYSMLKVPERNEFPIGKAANQGQWLDLTKTDGCYTCHQLGNKATRTIPKELGHFNSSVEAWARRIASGQAMTNMTNNIGRFDAQRMLGQFADWTDRIAAGELPASRPERPQGLERNVVISLWDWSRPTAYLHDEISSDKRNPTVNAYGLIYGATEESTDFVPVLDPVRHTASEMKVPVRDPKTPSTKNNPMAPSAYWGAEPIWDSQTSPHNPMLDEKGRVWFTSRVRGPANPAFCGKGSDHPSAKIFPVERSNRQLSQYDPKTGRFTLIDTCFGTHHLYFAEDANNTLWASSGGAANEVLGWLNRRVFEETGDEQKAQGWTPFILDTNGNGRRDDYVGPNDPIDPKKDKRIVAGFYGLAPSPVDGSIWGSVLGYPGFIIRVNPGSNPPETALTEVFEPPFPGYSPRGMDIDRKGVVWAPLASGHFASFDRRKCKGPLNGPSATGKHCPEGWTLYPFPGPQLKGVTDSGSAEASYYSWVDQHDTFGLGKDVPIATGNANDALLALKDGKFVILRVPYPMGFYAKGLDGRIDDPGAGWKGRALWSTYATRAPFHVEGGKGTRSKVLKFQLRPDPLAN